ncbi:YafY family transcriptional regulator [Marinobacter halodurans]|uniref:YafY family transcriptional regulator n=1 Tax=Marinobacter halodurans TaxID=2528979 RepID=A0ABY1ZJM8_9GAMM|nr:YafY family protein [Marinobacter halodurans]TBW55206.1 YafY family transcriptional regulator [Marinobacter halodurans]
MSRFDRIYRIHDILRSARHPVPMRRFTQALEASRNTLTRDFEYLRDTLGAPLVYNRERNGHEYDPEAPVFELPGFWMNPGELYALLACEQLLEAVQPGMMAHRLAPLKERIRHLLGETGHDAERISERIQVQPMQVRNSARRVFDPVAEATLCAKVLDISYHGRSNASATRRRVHPQRLLHYRSNWYLLAHCEQAAALRLFSLDRISHPDILDEAAIPVAAADLDAYTSSSFGIFGGEPKGIAHLRFSDHAAQWVADEQWHPDQSGEWRSDGFHLEVPYADTRELVMDILRYGADVEVMGPGELRDEVVERVRKMAGLYC